MKEDYLYEQTGGSVIITAVTFDYHAVCDKYKLTQKGKIPSIRLVKRFCKNIINRNKGNCIVEEQSIGGRVQSRFQKVRDSLPIDQIKLPKAKS